MRRLAILTAIVLAAAIATPAPASVARTKAGWSATQTMAPAGTAYSRVTVAASRQGDVAVAWIGEQRCCTGTGPLSVRYRIKTTGRWSAPRPPLAASASQPTVAISQVGEPLLAWVDGDRVRAAVKERNDRWRYADVATGVDNVVAVRGAIDVTGRVTVAWVEQADAGRATIRSASVQLQGDRTAPSTLDLPVQAPTGPVGLAVGDLGTAVAVWPLGDGSIEYTLRTPNIGWSEPATLAPAGSAVPAAAVRVDVAPRGQAVAAWFGEGATSVLTSMLSAPLNPQWEAPTTLTTTAPGVFGNLAVSVDNGAAVAWAGACGRGDRQPVGVAHRAATTAPWRTVPSPPVLDCDGDGDRSIVSHLGIVRGPRIVLLSPYQISAGPDVAFGAQATLRGAWQRGALPGEQSVAELGAAGRVGLFAWSRPERRTALSWRQYVAP